MDEGLVSLIKIFQSKGYKVRQLYDPIGRVDNIFRICLPFDSEVQIFILDYDEFYHISLENNHRHFYAEGEEIGRNERYVDFLSAKGILDMVHRFDEFLRSFANELTSKCVALFVGLGHHKQYVNSDVRRMIVSLFYAAARERIIEILNT